MNDDGDSPLRGQSPEQSPNEGHDYTERLGADADGLSLAAYLTRRHDHSTETEWRARIAEGRVRVGSEKVAADCVLRAGQEVTWRRPPWREPEAPNVFAVLFEDDHLLAVAKPAGLPTLPGGGFLNSTLLHQVRTRWPGAAPLHRLGRFTSGVVLFARSAVARAGLTRQWAARRVGKRYRALAVGDPVLDSFVIRTPIGPRPHGRLGTVHAASADGKPARSRVRVLERRPGAFLCDVHITTGRPHQIRIHLAAAGFPLVGDPLYPPGGVPSPSCIALPGAPGYLLHATALRFRHPITRTPTFIHCAPPPPLRRGHS